MARGFSFEIKGVTLTMADMCEVDEYYKAACTAEHLVDEYGVSPDDALKLGYEVRRIMDKYGFSEDDAISEVMGRTPVS